MGQRARTIQHEAQLLGDAHPSPPVLPPASASPAPADARRGLVGLLRSADAWHSRGGAGRTARARDRRPCSSVGLGSQGDRRRTSSRSSCRSTRRQRARPSIADGRELDNCFMDCDSTRVLARSIHRLYIEGSGGNLSPHSFHPTVRIIGATLQHRHFLSSDVVPWSPVNPGGCGPIKPRGDNAELGKQHSTCAPPRACLRGPCMLERRGHLSREPPVPGRWWVLALSGVPERTILVTSNAGLSPQTAQCPSSSKGGPLVPGDAGGNGPLRGRW